MTPDTLRQQAKAIPWRRPRTLSFPVPATDGAVLPVFCSIHLGRSIAKNLGKNHVLNHSFWKMRENRDSGSEKQFMKDLEKIPQNKQHFLSLLQNDFDYFLPSKIDWIFHKNGIKQCIAIRV